MITICPHCRNSNWDKEVLDNVITCPECGANWDFIKMPLYIITGCSGVERPQPRENCRGSQRIMLFWMQICFTISCPMRQREIILIRLNRFLVFPIIFPSLAGR